MTVKSLPRYLLIVAHFAGDSTITRFLPLWITGLCHDDGFEIVFLDDDFLVVVAFAVAITKQIR